VIIATELKALMNLSYSSIHLERPAAYIRELDHWAHACLNREIKLQIPEPVQDCLHNFRPLLHLEFRLEPQTTCFILPLFLIKLARCNFTIH
jgi:hypothetical protein